MARYFKKRNVGSTIKAVLLMILCVALGVGAIAMTLNLTGVLKNEENLVHSLDEYEGKSGTDGNGLLWTVKKDGSVHCKGQITNKDLDEATFVLGTVEIVDKGFYTLTGAAEGSKSTFYIKAEYEDDAGNLITIYSDFDGECTSLTQLDAGTEVTITIVVKSGVEIDQTFKPTFVLGEVAGKF